MRDSEQSQGPNRNSLQLSPRTTSGLKTQAKTSLLREPNMIDEMISTNSHSWQRLEGVSAKMRQLTCIEDYVQ